MTRAGTYITAACLTLALGGCALEAEDDEHALAFEDEGDDLGEEVVGGGQPLGCSEGMSYGGGCSSTVISNSPTWLWQSQHNDWGHTEPSEFRHDVEKSWYPYRPSGGAPAGPSYEVFIYWRSYHRTMVNGRDTGHCASFCRVRDQPYAGCTYNSNYDGITLQPERIERLSGPYTTTKSLAFVAGPYQNYEGKWEWKEIGSQTSADPTGPTCAGDIGVEHDWTDRAMDLVKLSFKVEKWNGWYWPQHPSYKLHWDEDDGWPNGNDDFSLHLNSNQPGVIGLNDAVETCLRHGARGQRYTLARHQTLMLCEDNDRCADHMFEINFDIQCRWNLALDCSVDGSDCSSAGDCCGGYCNSGYCSSQPDWL